MKPRLRISLIVAGLAVLAASLVLVSNLALEHSIQYSPTPIGVNPSVISKQEAPTSGLPMRLKIPSINLDAGVVSVGLTSDGAMDVPKDITSTAWFEIGPRPGDRGSAVIDGHFGRSGGKPAVFNDLSKLNKGDKMQIEDENGVVITFVVTELKRINQGQDTSDVFKSGDALSHLNLITCEGAWSWVQKSYPQRLVVFSDRE